MAVAVKTTPETTTRDPQLQLLLGSVIGAVFFLGSFWLIFSGLPTGWFELLRELGERGIVTVNPYLADALVLVVTIPVLVGVVYLGLLLVGTNPPAGTRAGAALLVLGVVLALWAGTTLGLYLESREDLPRIAGIVITLVVGGAVIAGTLFLFRLGGNSGHLQSFEEKGWLHATSFKPNQGVRVRRGSFVGFVVILLCGVYTLSTNHWIGNGQWNVQWNLIIPFTAGRFVPILYQVAVTVPLLLIAASVWASWRMVNYPVFADFLIATEAEINKVSWTTRKRLVQDTIVVLVAVVLMTFYLFVVDIVWIKVLSNPVFPVLEYNPQQEKARQYAPTDY